MTTTNLKLKTSVRFPVSVDGDGGVTVTKLNGIWTIGVDYSTLVEVAATTAGDQLLLIGDSNRTIDVDEFRSTTPGPVSFPGATSGSTTVQASDVASGTLTLPASTDTLVGKATTDTFTNKTFDSVATGNVLKINGAQLNSVSALFTISGGVLALANTAVVAGSYGNATQTSTFTVDAQGRLTLANNLTITPAVGSLTGLGTGIATALGVNVGTAGSPVVQGGVLGSPSSIGTLPAFTLGGTIAGGGNQLNNIIIGTTTPLAGSFTSLAATSVVVTSSGASALTVGLNGATNPALKVDASTASSATGIQVKSAAAAGGAALSVISSGTNEPLTIDAKGSGAITIGGTSTGGIIISRAITYGGVALNNAVSGTGNMVLGASPTITTPNIVGTTAGGDAAAGSVGEYISSTVLVGSAISLTTSTTANITSISLTAGDWDVIGNVAFQGAAGTASTLCIATIGTTSATLPTSPDSGARNVFPVSVTGVTQPVLPTGKVRISISGTTTVYLLAFSTFTVSTQVGFGFIGARRVR